MNFGITRLVHYRIKASVAHLLFVSVEPINLADFGMVK
jgi:hypothetical protein